MEDVAQACGVSRMTVSRVMRQQPHVKVGIRERVLQCARELNYRPDPALAALNRHRHANRSAASSCESLALLIPEESEYGWGHFRVLIELGADLNDEAGRLGYRLQVFSIPANGLTLTRDLRKLYNKGIRGLIMTSAVDSSTVPVEQWDEFVVVSMGTSPYGESFHSITISFSQMVELAIKKLMQLGLQRIGYLEGPMDSLTKFHALGSLNTSGRRYPESQIMSFAFKDFDRKTARNLKDWITANKPEAIVSIHGDPLLWVDSKLNKRLAGIELVLLNRPVEETRLSGIITPSQIFGRQTVNRLHQLLLDNALGIPRNRTILVVEGSWERAGKILPNPKNMR